MITIYFLNPIITYHFISYKNNDLKTKKKKKKIIKGELIVSTSSLYYNLIYYILFYIIYIGIFAYEVNGNKRHYIFDMHLFLFSMNIAIFYRYDYFTINIK